MSDQGQQNTPSPSEAEIPKTPNRSCSTRSTTSSRGGRKNWHSVASLGITLPPDMSSATENRICSSFIANPVLFTNTTTTTPQRPSIVRRKTLDPQYSAGIPLHSTTTSFDDNHAIIDVPLTANDQKRPSQIHSYFTFSQGQTQGSRTSPLLSLSAAKELYMPTAKDRPSSSKRSRRKMSSNNSCYDHDHIQTCLHKHTSEPNKAQSKKAKDADDKEPQASHSKDKDTCKEAEEATDFLSSQKEPAISTQHSTMESTETLEPEEFHLAHNPCSSDSLKDGHHRPEEYLVADNVKYAPNKKKGGNLALRGAPGLSHLFSVGPTSNASVGVSRPSSVMDFANNSGKISYGQDNPQEHNTMLPVPTDVISSPILQPATAATIGQAFMDKDYHFSTLGPSAHRSGDITRPAKYTNISYLKKFLDTGDIPESSSSSDTDTDSGTDNESIASSADESDEPSNASFDSNVPGKHPHYQGSEYRPQQLNPPGISPERQPLLSSRDQWPENGAVESLPQTMMASGRRMMAAPDTSKRSSSSSLSKNRQSHASPPLYQLSGHDSSGYPYARHRRSSGVASSHGHSQSRSRRRKGSRRHSHTSREALFLDKTGFMDTSYRFTFFNPEVGTVRARDLDDLRTPTYTLVDLLELDGCFWLDVMNPTQNEMRVISKTFGIHALTVEDIMTQDSREKCEVHMNYYFICFRSFVSDPNSEFYMHPINMYNIVLRNGIISTIYPHIGLYLETSQNNTMYNGGCLKTCLRIRKPNLPICKHMSFHAEPTPHQQNVLRRIRHLMDQVIITPDWINYAIIDDITDQLAPIIRSVEFEVESIDELVLILSSSEQSDMLLRIGSVRKKTMLLLRLLQGKADVVRALIKRFESATAAVAAYSAATAAAVTKITPPPHNPQAGYQAKVVAADPSLSSYSHQLHDNSYRESSEAPPRHGFNVRHVPSFVNNGGGTRHGTPLIPPLTAEEEKSLESANMTSIAAQKGHEIRLYLGDILDHIVTMVQNTNHYEAVISRAHSNYLAKISIELTETSNRTNDVVAKLSALASILVPLNVVTGLWGMNVPVPGQETTDLTWFLGILAAIVMFALLVILISRRIGIV